MTTPPYRRIVEHYERCFEAHGPGHLGVDWPNAQDAATRYETMLGVVGAYGRSTLLDFGCGSAGLLEFMEQQHPRFDHVDYRGHDLSPTYIDYCTTRFPGKAFTCGDVLAGFELEPADFIVANGVFTEKLDLTHAQMLDYFVSLVSVLFESVRVGLAFNVMSTDVDWERDDLFHLDRGIVQQLANERLDAACRIVDDYGLYEYTAYLYRQEES